MVQRLLAVFVFFAILHPASAEERVDVGFPAPGTVLVFEERSGQGSEATAWRVEGEVQYEGGRAYRLTAGEDEMLFDAGTKGWIATRSGGKTKAVSPHNGQLSSPLWVGKEWESRYLYERRDGSQSEQRRHWRVEGRETVRVPAGEFDTYRVVSAGKVLTITLWYAPAIDFYVRRTTTGMVDVEQVLVDYRPAP